MGSDVIYRSNAIRALTRIIDASTVQAIERLIKTAIVDKTPSVSSAALVSSYHLLPIGKSIPPDLGPSQLSHTVVSTRCGSTLGKRSSKRRGSEIWRRLPLLFDKRGSASANKLQYTVSISVELTGNTTS
jgi:hypothetical protein